MAVTSFIPEVWNARLLNALRADLVYTNLFNRNYEGDIRQAGDTVHINTITDISIKEYTRNTDIADPDQLTTTDQTLVVDQARYFNFFLDDVDKAQAKPGLIDAAMASASHGLADAVDKYLADLLSKATGVITAGLGSTATPLQITAANAYELLVNMKTALDKANVPKMGRKVVLPPEFEGYMLMDNRFAANGGKGEGRLENGAVARSAGFDIYISNNVPNTTGAKYKVIACTDESNTYAEQLTETEAYLREKGFDDGVKGLLVFGAKVVRPAAVAVATVNFGAGT